MGVQSVLWASALGCLPGAGLCPPSPGLHLSQSPPEALFSVSLVIQETFSKQSFPGASFFNLPEFHTFVSLNGILSSQPDVPKSLMCLLTVATLAVAPGHGQAGLGPPGLLARALLAAVSPGPVCSVRPLQAQQTLPSGAPDTSPPRFPTSGQHVCLFHLWLWTSGRGCPVCPRAHVL